MALFRSNLRAVFFNKMLLLVKVKLSRQRKTLSWFRNLMTHHCQEEIKSRLKSGNACYHSVQNLLSSSLLSKNLKIKMYRTIILTVVCMGMKLGHSY